jgi:L-threonylcarbamoyladenylate synthase
LLLKHYAPKAKLALWKWRAGEDLTQRIASAGGRPGATHVIAHTHLPCAGGPGRVSVIPHDPEAFARAIYAELHLADESGAELILVEALPEEPAWEGIADRLRRGASGSE